MSQTIQGGGSQEDKGPIEDALESGRTERSYSRTMTEVESDEIREVRQQLREQAGSETAKVSAQVLGDKPRRILTFPVKHGVTIWNVLAITLVPICCMLLTTYVNA